MARKTWTAEEMLQRVREVAAEVGPGVTLRDFLARGGVPESQIRRQFGTWEALRRRAGLSRQDRDRRRVSDEQLWKDFLVLYRMLKRLPTARELDRLSRFSSRTYYVRFGKRRHLRRAFCNWLRARLDALEQAAADHSGR